MITLLQMAPFYQAVYMQRHRRHRRIGTALHDLPVARAITVFVDERFNKSEQLALFFGWSYTFFLAHARFFLVVLVLANTQYLYQV